MATATRKRRAKPKEKTILLTLTREQWQEITTAINWMRANKRSAEISKCLKAIDPEQLFRGRAVALIQGAANSTHFEYTAEETLAVFAVIINGIYLYKAHVKQFKHISNREYGEICNVLNGVNKR